MGPRRQGAEVLREAGLVTTERRGTQICHPVVPAAFTELRNVLDEIAGASAPAGNGAPGP